MKPNLLFEILKKLSRKQRKDLSTFITMSSNHLTPKEEILLALIEETAGKKSINERKFIESYLPTEERRNWNRIKSNFLKTVRTYLIVKELEEHPADHSMILTNIFKKNSFSRNLNKAMTNLHGALKKKNDHDELSNYRWYRYYENKVEQQKDTRTITPELPLMNTALDNFYLENKLRIACEELNRSQIIDTSVTSDKLSLLLDGLDVSQMNIGVQVYYYIYHMLSTNGKQYFDQVLSIVGDLKYSFTQEYLKGILAYLLNFCVYKMNQGEKEFAAEYITLVEHQKEQDLFLHNNTISATRFKNCITTSLIANKLDWAEKFFEEYQSYLDSSEKKKVLLFNRALILFHKEQYDECHEHIKKLHIKDLYYDIALHILSLKLNYYLLLQKRYKIKGLRTKIESTKKFIRDRKTLPENKRNRVLFFLKCLSKLILKKELPIEYFKGHVHLVDFIWLQKEVTRKE